jgi:integrator complex subunit 9
VSSQKDSSDLKIAADLASQFYWKTFKKEGINVTRLKGNLLMENGRHHLDNNKKTSKSTNSLVRCGLADYNKLLPALSEMGINASMELVKDDVESQNVCVVHTEEPYKALIEIGNTKLK